MLFTRRNTFLAVLVIFVLIFSVLGYLNLIDKPEKASPYQAISTNVAAILCVNDYDRAYENLMFKNLMWQELMSDDQVRNIDFRLRKFDSLFRSIPNFQEVEEELNLIVAFYPMSSSGFNHTFIIPTSDQIESELIDALTEMSIGTAIYGTYEKADIYMIQPKDTAVETIYATIDNNLLIASFKPDLVEDALRILHSKSAVNQDNEFSSLEKTTGDFSDWNFFLNYKEKGGMRLLGLDPGDLDKAEICWSGWTALDATMHSDLIMFNGFTKASNSHYLSLFDKQKAQDIDAIDIIPDDVSLFFHFGISNYQSYLKSKLQYLKETGKLEAHDKKVEELKQEFNIDIESELSKWVSNEFGVMYIYKEDHKAEDSKVVFFRISDKNEAVDFISDLSEQGGGQSGRLPVNGLLDNIESVFFSGLNQPYYAFVDKYIILSSNQDLIKFVKAKYRLAQTLKKSERYNELSADLSDQSNVYIYVHLNEGLPIYREILDKSSLEFFSENPEFLKKFEHIALQFKDGKKNMFYQHTAIDYNPQRKIKGNTLWEVLLDTTVTMKPQIVYNHYTNAREIFIQDVGNKIYLIDNKGNIIWKRQLKEPIQSEVYQIDIYRNNKLQILFSGESSIYLIDRKGRDVENYPIQLPAVTTNGLSVIDYEKNREYRLMIGVRGGKILNFDRFGEPIKGWDFECREEIVSGIRHFVLNGKDYISCVGSDGNAYILNRRGEIRIPLKTALSSSNVKNARLELSNDIMQCKYLSADESGNVQKLKFNGEKEVMNFEQFSENFEFLYDDINNDQKPDYIFLDSNKLMSFDHSKEKIFEVELESVSLTYPSLYHFNSTSNIGLTDTSANNILLFNDSGVLHGKFPLKGSSVFTISDINKDERYNIIVGLNDKLVVYNLEKKKTAHLR